jgi:two-component system phosphate regulon response regulator PhoB
VNQKPYILLVEDEPDIANLVTIHLKRAGYHVQVHSEAESALRAISNQKPLLAILDWMLPSMSGLQLCRKIESKFPVIMLTARTSPNDVITGLNAGADDYITKPFDIPILLARVTAVLRRWGNLGDPNGKSPVLKIGDHVVNIETHTCKYHNEERILTPMEFKLFVALAESTGKVLTRDRLIDSVQGIGVVVTERAIDQHIFTLRKKLLADADLIETVRGVGYRVREA